MSNQEAVTLLYGWEGNRRSSDALIIAAHTLNAQWPLTEINTSPTVLRGLCRSLRTCSSQSSHTITTHSVAYCTASIAYRRTIRNEEF